MRQFDQDWEKELAAAPFEKPFFTEQHNQQVHVQIRRREHNGDDRQAAGRNWLPVTLLAAIVAVCVLLLIVQPPQMQAMLKQVGAWFGMESQEEKLPEDTIMPEDVNKPENVIVPDAEQQPVEENQAAMVQFKSNTYAFAGKSYWDYSGWAMPVESGNTYKLLEDAGDFVQIENPDWDGPYWVPSWYVSKEGESEEILELTPYEMIIEQPVMYYAYPNEAAPSGSELEKGKVVQVKRQYGEWLGVEIITYDNPVVGEKWIPLDSVREYDERFAEEGYLRLNNGGTILYTDAEASEKKMYIMNRTTVVIEQVNDSSSIYQITAAGGMSGYIKKEDFIPNPFEYIRGTYLELTEAEQKALDRFIETREDEALKGFEPRSIFKIYHNAEMMYDEGLMYDLLYKEEGMPSRETFILEAKRTPHSRSFDIIMFLSGLETREEIKGDEAVIWPIYDSEDPGWAFRLNRTDDGIWKAAWLARQ